MRAAILISWSRRASHVPRAEFLLVNHQEITSYSLIRSIFQKDHFFKPEQKASSACRAVLALKPHATHRMRRLVWDSGKFPPHTSFPPHASAQKLQKHPHPYHQLSPVLCEINTLIAVLLSLSFSHSHKYFQQRLSVSQHKAGIVGEGRTVTTLG